MNKVWVYKNPDDSYTIFYIFEGIPESLQNDVIEVDNLQEGVGILRRAADGMFYYEPFPEPEEPEVNPEQPIKPEPPESLEERIARLESIIEQNNLITVDAVLGVYEELVALREEIAASKGTTDNA